MKYVIIFEQRGEGCDYTIGCGIKFKIIEANDLEDARNKAKEYFLMNYCYGAEWDRNLCNIEYMTIAENPEYLPVGDWWNEVMEEKKKKAEKAQEAKEKAELARLLKKYGE
jgi:hypothetical protein